jgi:hypothetical protein
MAHERELDWRGVTISIVGVVGLQVSYTAAFQDAQRAAMEWNERQEAAFEAAHPDTP